MCSKSTSFIIFRRLRAKDCSKNCVSCRETGETILPCMRLFKVPACLLA